MSRSTLQAIWPGEKHENIREFNNSWGTAPVVWDEFCARYLKKNPHWWCINGSRPEGAAFWDLWKDPSIPASHRAVFLWTLDNIYVRREDFRRFANDLRQFLDAIKIPAGHVNLWPLIAQWFEADPDYPAVSLWCTSVTSDPFDGQYNEADDDYEEFDWSKAYNLYAELDSVDGASLR